MTAEFLPRWTDR